MCVFSDVGAAQTSQKELSLAVAAHECIKDFVQGALAVSWPCCWINGLTVLVAAAPKNCTLSEGCIGGDG